MARLLVGFVAAVLFAAFASYGAQDYDFDWVTIGAAGNDPYLGDSPFGPDYAYGRGSVGYEYRIGRTEVTTGQWLEFVNTFSTQSDDMKTFAEPFFWGAQVDPTYEGPGRRYRLRGNVASPELLPVGGISWREAAMFCNWLHNGKSSALSAIEHGAYDASTWGDDGRWFTDDPTHLPGARFWIPTLDEALQATSGTFSGSLSLDRLRDPVVGSEEGVLADGDLDADITTARSVLEPIVVQGDFPAGRIVEIGRTLQTNTGQSTSENRGRIEVTGALAGDILSPRGGYRGRSSSTHTTTTACG